MAIISTSIPTSIVATRASSAPRMKLSVQAAKVAALVREVMEGAATLSVPLSVEVGVGPNWYDTK